MARPRLFLAALLAYGDLAYEPGQQGEAIGKLLGSFLIGAVGGLCCVAAKRLSALRRSASRNVSDMPRTRHLPPFFPCRQEPCTTAIWNSEGRFRLHRRRTARQSASRNRSRCRNWETRRAPPSTRRPTCLRRSRGLAAADPFLVHTCRAGGDTSPIRTDQRRELGNRPKPEPRGTPSACLRCFSKCEVVGLAQSETSGSRGDGQTCDEPASSALRKPDFRRSALRERASGVSCARQTAILQPAILFSPCSRVSIRASASDDANHRILAASASRIWRCVHRRGVDRVLRNYHRGGVVSPPERSLGGAGKHNVGTTLVEAPPG